MAVATFKDLVIDASDARRLGAFWAEALGLRLEENGPTDVVLRGRTPAHTVWIDEVPEPKTVKNRVHLDVNVGGGHHASPEQRRRRVDAEAERLVEEGATSVGPMEQRGERWVVMQDPEGNEFCLQ